MHTQSPSHNLLPSARPSLLNLLQQGPQLDTKWAKACTCREPLLSETAAISVMFTELE